MDGTLGALRFIVRCGDQERRCALDTFDAVIAEMRLIGGVITVLRFSALR